MKRIIILGLIAALMIPGCGQTDSDKVVMTVSEYEALKAQAEKASESEESASETAEKSEAEEVPTETPKPSEDVNLIGEWGGEYDLKLYDSETKTVNDVGKSATAFLSINEDGSWSGIINGEKKDGRWEKVSDSGKMLSLIRYETLAGKQEEYDGWSFGYVNNKYIFTFVRSLGYDVEMTRQ